MENYNRASSVKQSARIEGIVEKELLHSKNSQQLQNEIHSQLNENEEEEPIYDETSSDEEEIQLQQENKLEQGNTVEGMDLFGDIPPNSGSILLIHS